MEDLTNKGLSPTEIVDRLVDTLFGMGFETYGDEHVVVTITPEFARGDIAFDNNDNKIYKRNKNGEYALSVAYVEIDGVAVEKDFERPYPKLCNIQFVKFKSICSYVGSIGRMLNNKGVKFEALYRPYRNSPQPHVLFSGKSGMSPELLEETIKDLLRKSEKGSLTPHGHFDKVLFDFVFT